MKKYIAAILMLGIMSVGVFAEEPKKEAPKPEVPFCAACRIKELTAEFNKLQQAIIRGQARQEQIRGAIIELQRIKSIEEKNDKKDKQLPEVKK